MPTTMRGWGRVARCVAYLLLAGTGALTFAQVSLTPIDVGLAKPLWWVMAVWLTVGGGIALVGQLARRWTGEYVGLPLAGSSLIGFSLLQLNLYGWNLDMVPSTALLWAFGLMILARWRDVNALYHVAVKS